MSKTTIPTGGVADDAIDSQHYADGSIDTAHVADSQITTAKIGTLTQIVFNATQSASANANTLDDYEEGTWTPVWQGLSGSAGSSSTSASAAVYTKIGRTVSFSCQARWSDQGSYSGLAVLTGLPFTSSSSNSSGCSFGFIELVDFKGGTLISAQVAGSQAYITWREINDDGSPTGLDISALDNGSNDMVVTGQYIV
jgi:hypothetical protein